MTTMCSWMSHLLRKCLASVGSGRPQTTPPTVVQDFALPDQARRVYRKDEFASNVNFGGYMYHPPPGVSVGPYNVYKLQIYATIKTSFYKVQRQKQRSSAYDIEPNEVASNNSNYNDTFTSTLRVINDIRGESYPARAEFTLLLGDAVNLIQERDDAFRYVLTGHILAWC